MINCLSEHMGARWTLLIVEVSIAVDVLVFMH